MRAVDSGTLQTLIVALIVTAAALFVAARWYRTLASAKRKNDKGCAGGCDCSTDG